MTSQPLSFDRVADIYDATRALPDHVLATIAQTIVTATNAAEASRFLELGVGTGRIALPLLQYGFSYTGVDISPAMIDVLRTKAGDFEKLTLVEADVTQLTFADASFDCGAYRPSPPFGARLEARPVGDSARPDAGWLLHLRQ